jgi:hypothetical protein
MSKVTYLFYEVLCYWFFSCIVFCVFIFIFVFVMIDFSFVLRVTCIGTFWVNSDGLVLLFLGLVLYGMEM